MLCCSYFCKHYMDCSHSVVNNPGVTDVVEPFDKFGSGSYSYNCKDNKVEISTSTMCQNYSMYYGNKEEKKEEKEMNDNLDVKVTVTPYIFDGTNIEMDFDHKLIVRSVWNHDEIVELEHDGHSFCVAQSELEKAIRLCSHNRW